MRTKIYLDKKMKADLPVPLNVDKFMTIFRVFYHDEWKNIEIRKEENKKCAKLRNASTTQKQTDACKD